MMIFFFFQAEDGIRDYKVTGVQTCALPILQAANKGLDLCCRLDAGVDAWLSGDRGRLRQVLVNLVANAVKFTERGEVLVRGAVVRGGVGSREWSEQTTHLRFSVRDSGIGIPRDRLDRLFQAFSQVDASTSRRYGGSGLGLAICRRLTELMGGTIGVESEPGQGSTFWFTAPLGPSQTARPTPGAPGHPIAPAADLAGR